MENGLAGILGEEIAGAGEYLRAGEIPGRSTGDPGRVPLSLRATAKGGERGRQLASLRQVFLVLQRSHPRAKRKPAPRIMHSCPEAHRWDTSDAKRDARCVGGSSLLGWIGAIGMKDGLAESYR